MDNDNIQKINDEKHIDSKSQINSIDKIEQIVMKRNDTLTPKVNEANHTPK